jgi:hypothetical protein
MESYSYTMLDENATWAAPDGAPRPAFRLESRAKDSGAKFPRVVSLVLKDSFVVVHADIFNRRNEVQKTFEAIRVERVEGYWTALAMRMTDRTARTHTDLVIDRIDYDTGLTAEGFTRRELERVTTTSSRPTSTDRP